MMYGLFLGTASPFREEPYLQSRPQLTLLYLCGRVLRTSNDPSPPATQRGPHEWTIATGRSRSCRGEASIHAAASRRRAGVPVGLRVKPGGPKQAVAAAQPEGP